MKTSNDKNSAEKKISSRVLCKSICFLSGVLLLVGIALRAVSEWYDLNYEMSFKELLYTLLSPLEGTGEGMIEEIVGAIIPSVRVAFLIYLVFAIAARKKHAMLMLGLSLSVALLVNSGMYAYKAFGIDEYVKLKDEFTTIYDDEYINPNDVSITSDGKPKNIIYIYLESMETTYASKELGGYNDENYIPYLTQLANENITFSDKGSGMLGGFISPTGTGWTIAAMMGSLCGVPFAFPVEDNSMDERETFASGITAFGDILAEKGYAQVFLCGSDVAFGGREGLYTEHGGYVLYDLYSAREEGYIPEDYHVWWGYEDKYLYDIAKDKITEMAAGSQPFNFTMLTVDTHAVGGYVCSECGSDYDNITANVVKCADRQIYEFIEWCKGQDFFEDTVIVISGDHPRHDQNIIGGAKNEQRTIYNCFINSAVGVSGSALNRTFTTFDMFPTVLAAMGFTIEGDRLGLGVNMFSGMETLAERFGYGNFNAEISKYSEYYILNFS